MNKWILEERRLSVLVLTMAKMYGTIRFIRTRIDHFIPATMSAPCRLILRRRPE